MSCGYLVLESGESYPGVMHGSAEMAGEVVFNTSHAGYEEMATDPSYFNQILLLTAPMQGNYGQSTEVWESERLWISGFVCVEMQSSSRDSQWKNKLLEHKIPILTEVDTRRVVLRLRDKGSVWGALVCSDNIEDAKKRALELISRQKHEDLDWAHRVSASTVKSVKGEINNGVRIAVIDYGCKKNIVRELLKRCEEVKVFPARTSAKEIKEWSPNGILLSNGPGNPEDVQQAVGIVRDLLGWRFIFGICMGHQILSLALGAKTFKLPFGHRGSNHPIDDRLLGRIYVTSQNHGYAVESNSLPEDVKVTHINLNDMTIAGISCVEKKCLGVQFHPESHPGPHDAETLFDYFIKQVL